jgi:hypothetical protein
MYGSMCVCMDACMYVWMDVRLDVWKYVCMYRRVYVVNVNACTYARTHVCMDACTCILTHGNMY